MERSRHLTSQRLGARAVGTALVTTAAATSLAIAGERIPPLVAGMAYVIAVTISAAREGIWGGLAASLLSFIGLNFFFTTPRFTFTVEHTEDIVALFAFLVVSGTVGTLLSNALAEKQRAEQREREARLLHHVANRLLSGEPIAGVLTRFAEALTDLLGLARCEVATDLVAEEVIVERSPSAGAPRAFPMATQDREVGQITVVPADGGELGQDEQDVIRTFGSQMALALERLRLASEAQRAQVEAEESRLRAALFSSVTHDLRTPLASITAAATSLEDPQTTFEEHDRRELLETIRQEAERLDRLVGELMDLARMRAGALTPATTPVAIEEVIEGVLGRFQPLVAGREVRLQFHDDLPQVPVDITMMGQVLSNLLENAAKFSPEGSEITISAARWQSTVEVRVSDHGTGIPLEQRDKVFEPFVRGDDHPRAGTGLGLSIARAIVAAHAGKMWIDPTPGGGTTVVFTLPTRAGG